MKRTVQDEDGFPHKVKSPTSGKKSTGMPMKNEKNNLSTSRGRGEINSQSQDKGYKRRRQDDMVEPHENLTATVKSTRSSARNTPSKKSGAN